MGISKLYSGFDVYTTYVYLKKVIEVLVKWLP